MEFLINRSYLLEACSNVARAISPHSPRPVLSGILIQASDDSLTLTGTSANMTIQTTVVPGELSGLVIIEKGGIVVEARTFLELLRRMDGTLLRLSTLDSDILRISNPGGQFDLMGHPDSDYPDVELSRPETELLLPLKLLQETADQVGYAAAEKNQNVCLMGINFRIQNGQFRATASDSYRLATKTIDLEGNDSVNITVPRGALNEVVRIADEENVQVFLDKNKIQFLIGKTILQSQLYPGNFPDPNRIIPASYESSVQFSKAALESVLGRTSIYASKSGTVPLRMTMSPAKVSINTLARDVGSSQQDFTEAAYSGPDMEICFNGKLMLDAVKNLGDCETVLLEFSGALTPMRMTSPEVEGVTMIVVPIRSN